MKVMEENKCPWEVSITNNPSQAVTCNGGCGTNQNGHTDLKGKIDDIHFHYQLGVSQDACLVQIWSFQLISDMSYRAEKAKFTDGQTGVRAQTATISFPHETLRCKISATRDIN